nr:Uncharacterised protein [Klebsiella pneumoniae]
MRILPIITAIAVSFLSVACSTPARRRASPWSVPSTFSAIWVRYEIARFDHPLKAVWKRSRSPGTHVMTAVWMW